MQSVVLLSNGDFRDAVNEKCWPKQEETLQKVEAAFSSLNTETHRGNDFKSTLRHGFIATQAEGCRIFEGIDPEAPVVVVLSSWAWAHHLASSAKLHKGPILILGNFDGTWPGLVALLNHSATYERLGIPHSRIWSDRFVDDPEFMARLSAWLRDGSIEYPAGHLTDLGELRIPADADAVGCRLAADIFAKKRILGQLDPGCMGMLNAVISPDKLAQIGLPVEYLSQSDLLAEMSEVRDSEAEAALSWLERRDVVFHWGKDRAEELTRSQVTEQMRMYIAAGRIVERYGIAAIGIPYQYGLVRCTAASDLSEGMLNNSERPDITDGNGSVIREGRPIVHFNEGDLGSGVVQILLHDLLAQRGLPPETTLHDVRWGREWDGEFVWVLEVSGGAPPAHYGGWKNTHVYRQPPMYFPMGGGTCSGVSVPGVITWARFYESWGEIGMDIGSGEVVGLPENELAVRREATNKEWPIANVRIPGYGRDELMSTHRSNHITIAYGDVVAELAAAAKHLGIPVRIVGEARGSFTNRGGAGR